MDIIKVKNISIHAYHGVLPEERERGQKFLVSVELEADLAGISASDDLTNTVNYADITDTVKKVMGDKPCNLIETLAEKIALEILRNKKVNNVKVTVEKPHPPLPAVTGGASVTFFRSRDS